MLRWRVVLLFGVVGAVLARSAAIAPAVSLGRSAAQPLGPEGSWIVKSSDSIVGFRAREKYLRLPVPSEVVGRTSVITGSPKEVRTSDRISRPLSIPAPR